MRSIKKIIAALIPSPIFEKMLSAYHFSIAWLGAVLYGFPARKMLVIAVTGTKGKSSTAEMMNAILEEAGYTTSLVNSIRFKLGNESKRNLTRMSMPGRFFIQRFLHDARKKNCTAAILEMTSEGARQHRHRFIDLDALIFTNLAPEHIESHGSLLAYANAKFEIGKELARSRKRPRTIVANADDKESGRYLTLPIENAIPFSLSSTSFEASEHGGYFTLESEKIHIHLPGEFSLRNALAASLLARVFGITIETIKRGLDRIQTIQGRGESIRAGQNFTIVVDYAHTPDSLKAIYDAYATVSGTKRKLICVLGSTGGGRDTWKRPVMGRIADERCDTVILTNEDPYDENPEQIVTDLAHGMSRKPEIIMDRRVAIRHALAIAREGDAVLITGKGTDPDIRGPRGSKLLWSDAEVVREEVQTLLKKPGV